MKYMTILCSCQPDRHISHPWFCQLWVIAHVAEWGTPLPSVAVYKKYFVTRIQFEKSCFCNFRFRFLNNDDCRERESFPFLHAPDCRAFKNSSDILATKTFLRCLNLPNCGDTQEIIYAFWGRFKCFTATVWIQCYKQHVIILFCFLVFFFFCSDDVDPTRITVPPLSLDVTTGQSLVLPCEVSSDSSLNPKFKWFFNGKAIDFSKQEHFEMIGKVFMKEDMCSRTTLPLLFKQTNAFYHIWIW